MGNSTKKSGRRCGPIVASWGRQDTFARFFQRGCFRTSRSWRISARETKCKSPWKLSWVTTTSLSAAGTAQGFSPTLQGCCCRRASTSLEAVFSPAPTASSSTFSRSSWRTRFWCQSRNASIDFEPNSRKFRRKRKAWKISSGYAPVVTRRSAGGGPFLAQASGLIMTVPRSVRSSR